MENHQAYSCLRAFALAVASAQKASPHLFLCFITQIPAQISPLQRPSLPDPCITAPWPPCLPQSQSLNSPHPVLFTHLSLSKTILAMQSPVICFLSQLWAPRVQGSCLLSILISVSRTVSNTQQALNKELLNESVNQSILGAHIISDYFY